MKKLSSILLVVCLTLTVVASPLVSVQTQSTQISTDQMQCMIGGAAALDCNIIAAAAATFCAGLGGGWLACAIVGAGAYLGCLAANAIVPIGN